MCREITVPPWFSFAPFLISLLSKARGNWSRTLPCVTGPISSWILFPFSSFSPFFSVVWFSPCSFHPVSCRRCWLVAYPSANRFSCFMHFLFHHFVSPEADGKLLLTEKKKYIIVIILYITVVSFDPSPSSSSSSFGISCQGTCSASAAWSWADMSGSPRVVGLQFFAGKLPDLGLNSFFGLLWFSEWHQSNNQLRSPPRSAWCESAPPPSIQLHSFACRHWQRLPPGMRSLHRGPFENDGTSKTCYR